MAFGALVCLFAPNAVLPARRSLLVIGLVAGVILSQSKSAFFSVLISFVVVSIVSMQGRQMRRRGLVKMIASQLVALILVSVVFYFYGAAVAENMTRDYADRTALSERVIARIAEFDWAQMLFGVGFHGADYINPATGAWITSHNSYINLLADLGACGFGLVVCLFVVMVATIVRDREWHLLAGVLGLLLHFVTEAFLYAPLFVMTVGTLYGVTCVYSGAAGRRLAARPLALNLAGRRRVDQGLATGAG
jgi:hypothetical protein